MNILWRYILSEILGFFAISLGSFTGLLLTLKMLRLTSLIINRGVELAQISKVFIAIIPTFLEIALPAATLLGVILAFARLCGDSEIVVMKASGISLSRFLRPISIFAVSVFAISLVVSVSLKPWGFRALTHALFDIARSKSTSGLSEGIFNKLGPVTLYAERIDYTTGELTRVLVDDKRQGAPRKIVVAKRGRIIADEKSQNIALLLADGVAHETVEGGTLKTAFESNSLSMNSEELHEAKQKGLAARELPSSDLYNAITMYKEAIRSLPDGDGEKVSLFGEELDRKSLLKKFRRAKIELGQRLSLPYASFIMAFVGMALGIMSPRTQRTWGASFSAVLGIIVFAVYYGLFSVGLALADQGAIKIWIALWSPNILLTFVAAFFVYKLTTEQWQSVSEGIFSFCGSILTKVRRRGQ